MMSFLYNLGFLVFGIFYAPVFLVKLRQAEDPATLWRERRGIFPPEWVRKFSGKKIVWLHAVSVGEVMAVEKFIQEWLAAAPEYDLLLTTVTPTGQRIAKRFSGERVHVGYFPFDLTPVVKRFFDTFRPEGVLLVETEIWPNLLTEARARNIPVGVINARLSQRSFKRYRIFPWLFKPLWGKLDFVLAQSEEDAVRFRGLGIREELVRDMGNMKFDQPSASDPWKGSSGTVPIPIDRGAVPNGHKNFERGLGQGEGSEEHGVDLAELRQAWGYAPGDLVWIAGSTHPGEEEVLMTALKVLRERFPALKLVLAPRHIERSKGLLRELAKYGFSMVSSSNKKEGPAPAVQVLDQLGVLKNLYGIADL
ncbi:MAG: glycosyltransferase N-terminal domain-containing protein, partial [Candidatus Omnitrophica bacterium]|nr:glycosyltransferase N-terminal domain-containing protein [Candidatus Omnitrophota bacterium]